MGPWRRVKELLNTTQLLTNCMPEWQGGVWHTDHHHSSWVRTQEDSNVASRRLGFVRRGAQAQRQTLGREPKPP